MSVTKELAEQTDHLKDDILRKKDAISEHAGKVIMDDFITSQSTPEDINIRENSKNNILSNQYLELGLETSSIIQGNVLNKYQGTSDTLDIVVTAINDAPIIDTIPTQTIVEDGTMKVRFNMTDENNELRIFGSETNNVELQNSDDNQWNQIDNEIIDGTSFTVLTDTNEDLKILIGNGIDLRIG